MTYIFLASKQKPKDLYNTGHHNRLACIVLRDQILLLSNFRSSTSLNPFCLLENAPVVEDPVNSPFPSFLHNFPCFTLQWEDTLLTHPKLSMVYYATWKYLKSKKQKTKKAIQNIDVRKAFFKQGNILTSHLFLTAFHFYMFNN